MKMMHLKDSACATVFISLIYIALSAETTLYEAVSKDKNLTDVSMKYI